MRSNPVIFALVCAACGAASTNEPALPSPTTAPTATVPATRSFDYPAARRSDHVDDYFGTQIADPYRWLEDLDSTETRTWVDAQVKLTSDYLDRLPARAKLKERLTALWNYERYGVPFSQKGRYFFYRNTGLQNQSVLYTSKRLSAEPQVLIDPNTLSTDGTVALSGIDVSDDAKLIAYRLASSGSDMVDIHIKKIDDGTELSDVVHTKFSSAAWSKDGKGFYYTTYDRPKDGALKAENRFPKVRYHRLGTTQDKDELVYDRPDQPDYLFSVEVSDDGRWLILYVSTSKNDKNLLFARELGKKNAKWNELVAQFEDRVSFIGNVGNRFFLQVDRGAPRGKVVALDVLSADRTWHDVVPETTATLRGVSLVNQQLVANYLDDAHSRVTIFDQKGQKVRDVALPGIGTAAGFGGAPKDKETFYSFSGYTTPGTIYRYDLVSGTSEVFRSPKVAFDPSDYETQQVFFTSKDGAKVPMFLTYKKGLKRDGQNPVFLYGYGGFDIATTPRFSVSPLVWMEAGGVYADVVLRGGGEYGEEWHQAAMKDKKQNVFNDFIAAAEYLVAEKVSSPAKIAIGGGSNGGLLVGAMLAQRPDLFGAAVPQVGVMDMLRFQKFTIGWTWASEYGSSDDPDQFKYLLAYSPLHNLKPGVSYPPTLVTTGDHDDRVFPAHSFKFAATLQANQAGSAPILIRIDTKAGHGAGKPTTKLIEESADRLAFMANALGITL